MSGLGTTTARVNLRIERELVRIINAYKQITRDFKWNVKVIALALNLIKIEYPDAAMHPQLFERINESKLEHNQTDSKQSKLKAGSTTSKPRGLLRGLTSNYDDDIIPPGSMSEHGGLDAVLGSQKEQTALSGLQRRRTMSERLIDFKTKQQSSGRKEGNDSDGDGSNPSNGPKNALVGRFIYSCENGLASLKQTEVRGEDVVAKERLKWPRVTLRDSNVILVDAGRDDDENDDDLFSQSGPSQNDNSFQSSPRK